MATVSTPSTPAPGFGRLAAALGRPASEWTWAHLADYVWDEGIGMVSLMHVGGDGWLKTLDFVPQSRAHLEDVLRAGERADGSSLFSDSGLPAHASDILLRPRPQSAFLDPFAERPTLVVLCDHLDREGRPLGVAPSTIVQAAYERLREATGVELWALGEVEYFLGKRPQEGDVYGADDRGYHATAPFVFGENLRRRAIALLGEMGVAVKYAHSEVGYIEASEADGRIWEQHEIELALAPLPQAADAVVLTQWVLRHLAHDEGMRCSFDPIVRKGHAGSGLHFHFSPRRGEEHCGRLDAQGRPSPEAGWLIGGLVRGGSALMAFGNRMEESFVRLGQGKEAPEAITWGQANRHALVRLPIQTRGADGVEVTPPTIEFRLPDGSVHPHMLLGGVAQATMAARDFDDLDELLASTRANGAPEVGTRGIPRTFREVAAQLEGRRGWLEEGGVFPSPLVTRTVERLTQA